MNIFLNGDLWRINVRVDLDLSSYATKADYATGVGSSKFAKKVDLASLKSEIDKLHIGKLEITPAE